MPAPLRPSHPLAGKTVRLECAPGPDGLNGQAYALEDWWVNLAGQSWMDCAGNPACLKYALRAGFASLPIDNEVVYGKVDGYGHLVHVSELGAVLDEGASA